MIDKKWIYWLAGVVIVLIVAFALLMFGLVRENSRCTLDPIGFAGDKYYEVDEDGKVNDEATFVCVMGGEAYVVGENSTEKMFEDRPAGPGMKLNIPNPE